ncbi:hypothetical protein A3D11_00910 [Candidatus Peribacteria bacterium RIFCSPHIGHO2_02_FULL_49_16]|nr:MAG: hypothetical protein A2880_01225 [Candidatus Peribacteria bacterium RIFCSPHIGHO2_01_FULL_49_38]OGJ60085.1 MAG: hypothetical protein A3D11_00910 [Candidatus Peribacteria bacterium RIFCSPHIGHO2_02_FULL_49_16]
MKADLKNPATGKHVYTLCFGAEEEEQEKTIALQQLGSKTTFSGFRPGKAPRDVLLQQIDPQKLLETTLRLLIGKHLPKLVKEQNITPIIPPRIELTAQKPLTVSITLIERPVITMSSPKKLPKKQETRVSEKEVETVLMELKKKENITELTDDLVQTHWNISSLGELKEHIKKSIYTRKEREEEREQDKRFFQNMIDAVKTVFPKELIEEEAQKLLQSTLQRISDEKQRQQWLRKQQERKDQFIDELHKEAERQIKFQFGIEKYVKDKGITISEEDMQKSITVFLQLFPEEKRKEVQKQCKTGGEAYTQLQWQKLIEAVKKTLTSSSAT